MSKEILTTDEVIDTLRPAVDAMAVTVYGAVSNRDAAVARVLRAALASRFAVSIGLISHIKSGLKWAHVEVA